MGIPPLIEKQYTHSYDNSHGKFTVTILKLSIRSLNYFTPTTSPQFLHMSTPALETKLPFSVLR